MMRQIAGAKCTWSVKGASRLVGFGPGEKAHPPESNKPQGKRGERSYYGPGECNLRAMRGKSKGPTCTTVRLETLEKED